MMCVATLSLRGQLGQALIALLHVVVAMGSEQKNRTGLITCFCSTPDENCYNGTCFFAKYCYSLLKPIERVYEFGCFRKRLFWQNCYQDVPESGNRLTCCRSQSFCNRHLTPHPMPTAGPDEFNLNDSLDQHKYSSVSKNKAQQQHRSLGVAELSLLIITALALCLIGVLITVFCNRSRSQATEAVLSSKSRDCQSTVLSSSNPEESVDVWSMSGKGSRLLSTRHVYHELKRKRQIGEGAFGEVWLCTWRGKDVAVKWCSCLSSTFEKEASIYRMAMISHPNILAYFSDDIHDIEGRVMSIVVTEYHPRGNLFDVLSTTVLSIDEMLRLAQSTTQGVQHLHACIESNCSSKPSIAHRDIKSRNILVKTNGEACIADLGLAMTYVMHQQSLDQSLTVKTVVGTRRYMAPEILAGAIASESFSSLLMADIYSLSLVLWEILSRCQLNAGKVAKYQQPYSDHVQQNPTVEAMKDIVVKKHIRPKIEEQWTVTKLGQSIVSMITACWKAAPTSRLTALRLTKNFGLLAKEARHRQISMSEESSGYSTAPTSLYEVSTNQTVENSPNILETSF